MTRDRHIDDNRYYLWICRTMEKWKWRFDHYGEIAMNFAQVIKLKRKCYHFIFYDGWNTTAYAYSYDWFATDKPVVKHYAISIDGNWLTRIASVIWCKQRIDQQTIYFVYMWIARHRFSRWIKNLISWINKIMASLTQNLDRIERRASLIG